MTAIISSAKEFAGFPPGTSILDAQGDVITLVSRGGRTVAVSRDFEDSPLTLSDSCFPADLIHDPCPAQEEAYRRGHQDGYWNDKTTGMSPSQAAAFMAPYRCRAGWLGIPGEVIRAAEDALHADACTGDVDDDETCHCGSFEREARIALEAALHPLLRVRMGPKEDVDYVDVANRAQAVLGRGVMPDTAKAIIEAYLGEEAR